jgi:hypothetical protein
MPDMTLTLPVQAARNKPKLLDQVRDVMGNGGYREKAGL